MTSKVNETYESTDMTHYSTNNSRELCKQLKYFKEFLRDLTKDAVTNVVVGSADCREDVNVPCNGAELRPLILTRNNNETYAMSKTEMSAELIISIYQWLHQKQCPEHFQIGLLELAKEEIGKELQNTKIQEDLIVSNSKQVETFPESCCFDLLKLQKFISQQMEKIIVRLSDNSKEENLKNIATCARDPSFLCVESAGFRINPPYLEACIKNKPRKMEDRHISLPQFSEIYQLEESLSFYGVFDGHSGSLAATYATTQIPYLVAQELKKGNKSTAMDTDYYREALETSFLKVDSNFGKKQLGSGTTAVCVLLKRDVLGNFLHLYVAWVGDSRCLLVSPTVHLQLVKPHKPDSVDERRRIESTETCGSVIFVQGQWRVNGIINVSRSIGDYTVKAVIAEPDIVDVLLQTAQDFILLGSDGLYDHVAENEIVDCVYKSLLDDEQCLEDIPKHLIELAKQGDSQDNITVILVLLKDRQQIKENFLKYSKKSC